MGNPSKIVEGGIEFSLGKFDGKLMVYDFPKILVYLESKGKLLFGNHFRIIPARNMVFGFNHIGFK